MSAAASFIWDRLATLATRADHATVDVVADDRRPNSYVVLIGGVRGIRAMRGAKYRCEEYASLLRSRPDLRARVLEQSQGWRR